MNLTPEIVKAAEEMCHSSMPSTSVQFAVNAIQLAHAILANRSDYDPDGRPLGVDEAFCKSLGMTCRTLTDGDVSCTIELPAMSCVNWWSDGSVFLGGTLAADRLTRPQLRQLLEALGGAA